MVRFHIQLAVIASLMFAAGCTTIVRSEDDLFARKHPDQRKHFTRLSPTDVESVRERAEIIYRSREWAIGAVTNRVSGETVAKEVAGMKQFATVARDEEREVAKQLEEITKSTSGQVYNYEFRDGQNAEWGFLVLRDGEIAGKVKVTRGKIYD